MEEIWRDIDKYFVLLEINLFTVDTLVNCQNNRGSLESIFEGDEKNCHRQQPTATMVRIVVDSD